MPTVRLDDRTILEVAGEDAEHFLQNLITTDLDELAETELLPGALLTPQGKILFDFLISRHGDRLRLDCSREIASDFVRRLTMYKLRARVEVSESDQIDIAVSWSDDSNALPGLKDRRFADKQVIRQYGGQLPVADASMEDWHALRIASGIGQSGQDFELGDAFPHDVLFDLNGGVSFKKGCFVGQEVVSRMQHRGTARRRLLIATGNEALPEPGTQISAGGRNIGVVGSVTGEHGLAMVRIDRAAQAMAEGTAIESAGVGLTLSIPSWAGFEFPQTNPATQS